MENSEIVLRCIEESDIQSLFTWHNDKRIKEMYAGHPFPVSFEATKEWINQVTKPDYENLILGIALKEQLIGVCGLKRVNKINRNAELFIFIGSDDFTGKGFAKTALDELLILGFHSLGLKRISLTVQNNNERAISLYKKCGFVCEGVMKEAVYKNNAFLDLILMAILKEDFEKGTSIDEI